MTPNPASRLATLRLARTPGLGARGFARLIRRFSDPETALEAFPELLRRKSFATPAIPTADEAARELERIDRAGASLLAWPDADYPDLLREIADPPPCLIFRGRKALLKRPACAIVGSRNASAGGLRLARTLSTELGQQGFAIISGLARGIDGAAHRAALQTGTIAVLAGGINHIYPPEHADLHHAIADNGLLVSERALGASPTARCFPRRNRIVSGLSLGSVIIEAALRSGSLITARCALEQNREVMALPGSPLDPRSRGSNQLLRDGAHLVETAEDILSVLGPPARGCAPSSTPDQAMPPALPPEPAIAASEPLVLDLISPTPVSIDEIARHCGFGMARLQAELLELELTGQVHISQDGQIYRP